MPTLKAMQIKREELFHAKTPLLKHLERNLMFSERAYLDGYALMQAIW